MRHKRMVNPTHKGKYDDKKTADFFPLCLNVESVTRRLKTVNGRFTKAYIKFRQRPVFTNVLRRFVYETKRALHMYIARFLAVIHKSPIHMCITRSLSH